MVRVCGQRAVKTDVSARKTGPRRAPFHSQNSCRVPSARKKKCSFSFEQPELLERSAVWVVPNPSGLNAHETVTSLAIWYRKAAEAAGIV